MSRDRILMSVVAALAGLAATNEGIPMVRARFHVNSEQTHVENSPGKSAPIPTGVDESSLSKSASAEMRGEIVQLRFRLFDVRLPLVAATSLLLWGGMNVEGEPFLNPAFVVDAPPSLPESDGPYQVTGLTAGGDELFGLNFAMPEVADGDGSSSFAFVLAAQPSWADNLASITLAGPGGSTTLDSDTDLPMSILLDPSSGQVRGILRDLPQSDAAAALAPQAGLDSLDVLFSRGIPDAAAWGR